MKAHTGKWNNNDALNNIDTGLREAVQWHWYERKTSNMGMQFQLTMHAVFL